MKLQLALDKSAMGLSFMCLAHCLLIPVVVILLPTAIAIPLEDELFHKALLIGVIPMSIIALIMGCRNHKKWAVLLWGAYGLSILFFAGFFGHDIVGETGEKILTVIGSLLIIVGHYKNYRLCGKHQKCEC